MCKTGAKQATGNDTIDEQDVSLSVEQGTSALSRMGIAKVSGGEFQVCSLSQVANRIEVANKL